MFDQIDNTMMSLSGNSVYPHHVLTVLFCLLTASQAYVNVALNKPAYQQYPNENDRYDASNAVDGRKSDLGQYGGQCAVSQNRQTATWWVNLTTIHSIHHITIYFMTNYKPFGPSNDITKYFLGFSVYVSNTTDRLQGTLCYKDDNLTLDTIPAVFTTTCPVQGQYVIYYNERLSGVTYPRGYSDRVSTDLCEVEVFGCPATGYFGSNCSVPCSDVNCQYCHIESGTCQGCKPGYKGHRCEMVCPAGFFGKICAEKCNTTCKGCNNVNGRCEYGCHSGWKGVYCQAPCSNRTYGENCSQTCGKCRNLGQCHHINGTCSNGCDRGYQGDKCDKTCDELMYGENCGIACGNCLAKEQCHPVNGTCMNGCDKGYQGSKCTEECDENFFGFNCKEQCYTNCDGCNKKTGVCDTGCKPGWKGMSCQEKCIAGFYGKNCNITCGKCLNSTTCHHITGSCDQGCDPGYEGLTCKKECDDKQFGPNCIEMCNTTCKSCNKSTRICDNGCHLGWRGLFCEEICDNGTYGDNCSMPCGQCLDSAQCHHVNGTCMNGCASGYGGFKCTDVCELGYYGLGCNQECSPFCLRSRDCHHVSGYCKEGCKNGWQGLHCLEVIKVTITEKKMTSEFNGILSAFCVLLFLIGIAVAYFVMKRFRNSKVQNPAINQSKIAQKECESDVSNVYINDNDGSEYQELGEIGKSKTYDTLQNLPNN